MEGVEDEMSSEAEGLVAEEGLFDSGENLEAEVSGGE